MSTKRSRKHRKRKRPTQSKTNTEHAPPRKKARISNNNLNKSYPSYPSPINDNENQNVNTDNYYSGPECPEPYVPPNTPNISASTSPRSPRRRHDSQSMGLGLSGIINEDGLEGQHKWMIMVVLM